MAGCYFHSNHSPESNKSLSLSLKLSTFCKEQICHWVLGLGKGSNHGPHNRGQGSFVESSTAGKKEVKNLESRFEFKYMRAII